jgi:hypothetical protein
VAGFAAMLCLVAPSCTQAVFHQYEDAGPGGTGDARIDGRDAGAADAVRCETPSMPSCISEGDGVCDPVCQTGSCNWCTEKCSYVYAASQGEAAPACVGTGPKVFPEGCTITFADNGQQSDDCVAGAICVPPFLGASPNYCFNLCRRQSDCLWGVPCNPRKLLGGGEVLVCDPQPDQCGLDGKCCDPLAPGSCGDNRYCFLVAPDAGHSRTVCEFSYEDGHDGSACTTARDCRMMNACVDSACRQVCSTSADCPLGQSCMPWGAEYGTCLPTSP